MTFEATKECRKCGNTKPLHLFCKDSQYHDGRQTVCKDCRNKKNTKRVSERKELEQHGMRRCHKCETVRKTSQFGYRRQMCNVCLEIQDHGKSRAIIIEEYTAKLREVFANTIGLTTSGSTATEAVVA